MKTAKIATRSAALSAFAKSLGRPEIERTLQKVRKQFGKARSEYESAQARLADAQKEVDKYQRLVSETRSVLSELSEHLKVMDLSGASGVREKDGEKFYILDNGDFHVDCSDVNDVKLTEKKEYLKNKADRNAADAGFDISFNDDFARNITASTSKRFK